jgi:protein TonB
MEVTLQADLLDAAAGAAALPAAASSVKVQPTARPATAIPAEPEESKEASVDPARESIEAAAEAMGGEGRSHSAALDAPAALPSEMSGEASGATPGPGGPAAAVVSGEASGAAASPGSDGALAKARAEEDPGAVFAARVGAAIEARKTYPEAARRRGAEGVVRLRLRVSPDGRLVAARLAAGSGSSLLDRAALGLASSVFPLDNPARRELEFALAVRYSLEDR